jgi:hypothetical protein
MDHNEIIALGIVAVAALLALRSFLGKKGGGPCGSDCLPKFEKKDEASKPEGKE